MNKTPAGGWTKRPRTPQRGAWTKRSSPEILKQSAEKFSGTMKRLAATDEPPRPTRTQLFVLTKKYEFEADDVYGVFSSAHLAAKPVQCVGREARGHNQTWEVRSFELDGAAGVENPVWTWIYCRAPTDEELPK